MPIQQEVITWTHTLANSEFVNQGTGYRLELFFLIG